MRRVFWLFLFITRPLTLDACDNTFLIIKSKDSEITIEVEIADSYLKRKQGLMFREHLNITSGMLFTYDYPQKVGFWMKNTKIPLDIAFADSRGTVVQVVYDTKPFSLDIIDGGENIQYVLEINAGVAEQLQLFEGSKLVHPFINKRIKYPC